jgi:Zn-dependent membrane protease YugP
MVLWLSLVLVPMLFALWTQYRTKSTFKRYSQIGSASGLTGSQVARRLLNLDGLHEVTIERIGGALSDHYDPRARTLRLSEAVHDSTSLAAIGVAAHEMGHALQHAEGYRPLMARQAFAPTAALASKAWIYLILGAMFLPFLRGPLLVAGLACLAAYALFALVTLPVEFDASRRAMLLLESSHTLNAEELDGSQAVLSAAAMTYVASAALALGQLAYFLLGSRR